MFEHAIIKQDCQANSFYYGIKLNKHYPLCDTGKSCR